jgi:hypothetical protein
VSFKNEFNVFICSRKPKTFVGNIQGILLPFHLPAGRTVALWVYSGPTALEPTALEPTALEPTAPAPTVPAPIPEPTARQQHRQEIRQEFREAREAMEREMDRIEEARRQEEARARIIRPPTPTVPAHFLAEFMEMSLQLKRGHSCPCCFDVVTKETIYLSPCGHIMCKDCHSRVMSTKVRGISGHCPTCRQEL